MHSRNFPSFPLSSHADFRQLVSFVRATKAKKVYLYTGYVDTFSEYLMKKLELKAKPLPPLAQTELGDF
jgi:Cft2 family RNA processing exonuclease